MVLEKSAVVGGTWRHQGNAFSRVNSSEPSYRILMSERAPMTNHSHHSEILREALRTVEQHALAKCIQTRAEVLRVAPSAPTGWLLGGEQTSRCF